MNVYTFVRKYINILTLLGTVAQAYKPRYLIKKLRQDCKFEVWAASGTLSQKLERVENVVQ